MGRAGLCCGQFRARQGCNKDTEQLFLLRCDGFLWVEVLFQGKPGGWLVKRNNRPAATNLIRSSWMFLRSAIGLFFTKNTQCLAASMPRFAD